MPPQDKPEAAAVQPAESPAARFYESAYKPFEAKFNEVPNKDKAETTPEQLKNGWQTADTKAADTFKALGGELQSFDSAETKVREASGKAFTETTDATTGAVTRKYNADGPLKDYTHTFNKDGSVELQTPATPPATKGESIKFQGDTATVTGPDGKVTQLDKAQTEAKVKELNAKFNAVNGEFNVDGKGTGTWKLDALGNTQVEKVPGITGGSMTVNHANTKDDVKYRGKVESDGKKPGYSTEVTGDDKTGYRFVDYDDSKEAKKTPGDAVTADGRAVEGFVSQRKDGTEKPPLTLVSDKPTADGSTTKIGLDGVAETTYNPPKNGKLTEKLYPPGHASGLASEATFDPKLSPDRVMSERRAANGNSEVKRETADGGTEVKVKYVTGDEVLQKLPKLKPGEDPAKQQPSWTRETSPNGVVRTELANGDVATFTPGGKPAELKLQVSQKNEDGTPKKNPDGTIAARTDATAEQLTAFMKTQPLSSETLSDGRTREVHVDGKTITRPADTKAGITTTELPPRPGQPGTIEHAWDAKMTPQPSPAELAKMTGLKPDDPRLKNVTAVKETPSAGPPPTTKVELTYGPNTPNVLKDGKETTDTKTKATVIRDGEGRVLAEERSAQTKEGRKYTDVENANGRTRTYAPNEGQKVGDQEVYNNKQELVQDRKVADGKITTTFHEGGQPKRNEVLDEKAGTWKRSELGPDGKPLEGKTTEGKLLQGANGQRLYMDGDGKRVSGLQIPGGVRAGDSYKFDRVDRDDPKTGAKAGDLKGLDVETNKGEKAKLVIDSTTGKWRTEPAGGKVPGFDAANADVDDKGHFKGKFSTNAKGELVYESGDKGTKQVLRGDGSKETYNMRDYSRIKEDANGRVMPKQYWDGYGSKANPDDGWRAGTETKDPATGKVTVKFTEPMANRPSEMTRNGTGANDSFEVTFPNGTSFKVGNWGDGKMTRTTGTGAAAKSETLYNTGTVGSDGRTQWAKGTPDPRDASGKTIKIEDPRVQTGEMPEEVQHVAGEGGKKQVRSRYKDGSVVESDLNGNTTRHKPGHKGAKMMEREYGKQGELNKFKQGATTGTLDRTNPVDGTSDWTVNMGGKDYKITGAKVVEKPGGQFEIIGKDASGKEAKFESSGRVTAQETFKEGTPAKDVVRDVVVDARGQKWVKTADAVPATPGDPAKPGTPPTWETGNPPKKFTGEMKKYENGNVAIQTNKDYAETVNSDGSVSKIDVNGFERERNYPPPPAGDGTYQKRGPQGELVEFKGKDGSVTKLEYDRKPGTNELAGGVKEVKTTLPDGTVRTEKRDQPPAGEKDPVLRVESGNPPKLGNEIIEYDRMGTRYVRTGTLSDNSTVATDVHGQKRTITTVGGKTTEITPGTASDTKLRPNYTGNDPIPTTIDNVKADGTKEVYERDGGTYKLKGATSTDAPRFTLEKDGSLKPAENNAGIDPAFSMQLEAGRARDSRPPGDTRPPGPTDRTWEGAEKILMDKYKDKGIKPGTVGKLRELGAAAGLKPEQITPAAIDSILEAGAEMLGTNFTPEKLQKMAADLAPIMQPRGSEKWQNVMAALGTGNVDTIKAALPESIRPIVTEKFVAAIKKAFLQPAQPAPQR